MAGGGSQWQDEVPSGPGGKAVQPAVIVALSVGAVALGALTLYSMWAFWPTSGAANAAVTQRVSWLGWHTTVNREFQFFLTVALAGGLGGLIHTIRSFVTYVGNRMLVWSWVPYNLMLPITGALSGTVFYLVLRAGLFSPSTSVQQASPFGFAAIAILAGLFSPQAFEKLRALAGQIFTETTPQRDALPKTGE
jgi:hypothetical protein